MSTDIILAQQFWTWPEPVMKRDSAGRIIFVNAAFLQMYGGTIEAWTGHTLEGWSAPHPISPGMPPAPNRFETRIGGTDEQSPEQIYDWLEQGDMDGSALAIARNVTSFTTQSQAHYAQNNQTTQTQHAPDSTVETSHDQGHQTQSASPADMPPQSHTQVGTQTFNHAPQDDVMTPTQNLSGTAQDGFDSGLQQGDPVQTSQAPGYDVSPEKNADPHNQQAPQTQKSEPTQPLNRQPELIEQVPSPHTHTSMPPPTEERDFQRRALPLESNNSILGNNWRDAVIAKAVGAESNDEETQTPQEEASNGIKPINILLAEDNAINALLTRTLLEAEGHTVETVEDGVLAVEAMKNQKYDLIFMDMRMPNMDGLEATRKIRQLPNVPRELPIIALTANAFDDDRNACFDSGMNDFMTKPVSAEELSAMVVSWTDKVEAARNAA